VRKLKQETGSRIAHPAFDALACTDSPLEEGRPLERGRLRNEPLFTPGHTDGHHSYRVGERVFTGDALLIDGCGRTDFQNGDARRFYRSVREKLFSLPEDTLVYPGHDYCGRRVSNIAQERTRNTRLCSERSLEEFVALMAGLNLPYPKFIDYAVPGNRQCGVCPSGVPEDLQQYRTQIAESRQG
jgi:sulfur dioxygenase